MFASLSVPLLPYVSSGATEDQKSSVQKSAVEKPLCPLLLLTSNRCRRMKRRLHATAATGNVEYDRRTGMVRVEGTWKHTNAKTWDSIMAM